MIPTPDAQCLQRCEFHCAFELFPDEENMLHSVSTRGSMFLRSRTESLPPGQKGVVTALSLLRLDGTEFVLTAVNGSIVVPGAVVLRFFNAADHAVRRRIEISSLINAVVKVRLDEEPVEELDLRDGRLEVAASPQEIISLRLERRA
jgi:alpha-mannosidase